MSTISINKRKYNKKINKYIILGLGLIAIATLFLIVAQGKYKLGNDTIHIQNSEMFYFESDLLKSDDSAEYTYYDWDGEEEYSIQFNLNNYEDALRHNTLPTSYEIIIPTISGVQIDSYINNVSTTTGEMEANKNVSDNIELKINSTNRSNIQFEIQIKSIEPYTKTLRANIKIIPRAQEEKYSVNLIQDSNMDYAKLNIRTSQYSGNLKIAYNDTKVMPDMSTTLLRNIEKVRIEDTNYYYIEIELNKNTNYEINFIKKVTNCSLTIGDNIADCDIVVGY